MEHKKLTPEESIQQAVETAVTYLDLCLERIESNPKCRTMNADTKFQCASRLALAASIDYATRAFSGSSETKEGWSHLSLDGHLVVENTKSS